jgi:hypothetical protein
MFNIEKTTSTIAMCGMGLNTNINLWLLFKNIFAFTFTMSIGLLEFYTNY